MTKIIVVGDRFSGRQFRQRYHLYSIPVDRFRVDHVDSQGISAPFSNVVVAQDVVVAGVLCVDV